MDKIMKKIILITFIIFSLNIFSKPDNFYLDCQDKWSYFFSPTEKALVYYTADKEILLFDYLIEKSLLPSGDHYSHNYYEPKNTLSFTFNTNRSDEMTHYFKGISAYKLDDDYERNKISIERSSLQLTFFIMNEFQREPYSKYLDCKLISREEYDSILEEVLEKQRKRQEEISKIYKISKIVISI